MMKQKKVRFEAKEQEPVILDGITLKHFKLESGQVATYIEIAGKDLDEQVDLGVKIETGKDENGYDIKYQVRFTAATNINVMNLTEGFYKLVSNNIWLDKREGKENILRCGQVDKFECYYEFTKENK